MSCKQDQGRNGQLANLWLSELNFTANFVLKYKTLSFFYLVRNGNAHECNYLLPKFSQL